MLIAYTQASPSSLIISLDGLCWTVSARSPTSAICHGQESACSWSSLTLGVFCLRVRPLSIFFDEDGPLITVLCSWYLDLWRRPRDPRLRLQSGDIHLCDILCDIQASHICLLEYRPSSTLPFRLLTHLSLVERVYIVWSPANLVGRFKSRIYIISLITVCLYGVVIIMMVVGASFSCNPVSIC